jgi:hypothetical protein
MSVPEWCLLGIVTALLLFASLYAVERCHDRRCPAASTPVFVGWRCLCEAEGW